MTVDKRDAPLKAAPRRGSLTSLLPEAPKKAQHGWLIRFIDRFLPRHIENDEASEDQRRQVRTAIGFLMASWLVALVFAISNLRQGFMTLAWIELTAVALLTWIIPMIRRTGRFELFGNIGMSSGVTTIFVACWVGDGLEAPALVLVPLIPAWAYLGYGRRSAGIWSWLTIVGVTVLFFGEKMKWMPPPSSELDKVMMKRFLEVSLGIGMGFLAARVFSDVKDYALGMLQKRTNELKEAHARVGELFDNMRQGVLAFDKDGLVEGPTSRQALSIFGRADLGGSDVRELLFAGDVTLMGERDNFDMWLAAAFEAGPDHWDELSDLTPRKIVKNAGEDAEQHLELEFRPVATDDGVLRRVMVLVNDETERVKLERAAKEKDDAHRKEVLELRRLAAGGAHLLLRFLETARSRFDELSEALHLEDAQPTQPSDVAFAFQHVHTIRGEARTFQLSQLEQLCTGLEERLAPLRAAGGDAMASDPAFRKKFLGDVIQARVLLDEAERRLVEVSPIGAAVLDQITVRKTHLDEACALAAQETRKDSPLARAMDRLAARPFGESTQQLTDAVPLWAKREQKRVNFELEGRDTLVPRKLSRMLGGALTHLVRNAIAHGVEVPDERRGLGKPAEATVRLSCTLVGDAAFITVEDDGRGIDEAAVRGQAQRLGLRADRPLDELLFEPGLSTSSDVSEIAGRGMGMSAVRRDLATVGYQVRIITTRGKGTRMELSPMQGGSLSNPPARRSA